MRHRGVGFTPRRGTRESQQPRIRTQSMIEVYAFATPNSLRVPIVL